MPLIRTSCGTNDGELPWEISFDTYNIWQVLCTFLDFFHKDLGTEGSDRLVNNDYNTVNTWAWPISESGYQLNNSTTQRENPKTSRAKKTAINDGHI